MVGTSRLHASRWWGLVLLIVGITLIGPRAAAADVLSFAGPTSGASTSPTFTGTGAPGDTVTVSWVQGDLCSVTVSPQGQWSCPVHIALPRNESILMTITDAATGESITGSYTGWPLPPDPSFTMPAAGSTVASLSQIHVTNPSGNPSMASTTILLDGTDLQATCGLTWPTATDWVCQPGVSVHLTPGTHTLTATFIDQWEQRGTATVKFTVATPPTAPTILTPKSGVVVAVTVPLVVTGRSDPGTRVTLVGEYSGMPVAPETTTKPDGTWTITIPPDQLKWWLNPPSGGGERLLALAVDRYGSASQSEPWSFTVVQALPTPTPSSTQAGDPTPAPPPTPAPTAAATPGPQLANTGAPGLAPFTGVALAFLTIGLVSVVVVRRKGASAHR